MISLQDLAVSDTFPDLADPVPPDLEPYARELLEDYLHPLEDWARARGARVVVDSGYRPADLNRALGAGPNSRHRLAAAADIYFVDRETGRAVPELLVPAAEWLRARGPYGELELKTGALHVAIPIQGRQNNKFLVEFDGEVNRLPDTSPQTMAVVSVAFFSAAALLALLRS